MTRRRLIGWLCLTILLISLVIGIVFPTLGANPPLWLNLSAWVVYISLFGGLFWGFGEK